MCLQNIPRKLVWLIWFLCTLNALLHNQVLMTLRKKAVENIFGKGEDAGPPMFSTYLWTKTIISKQQFDCTP